jgi:GNAT superfamily N-acetyltransferase
MRLRDDPLTDETLDDVVAFFRAANPFAQLTWGWDTGRFMDWRWGSNTLRAQEEPGWFAANCRVFRDDSGIRAIALAESGRGDVCIITPGREPMIVAAVLEWLRDAPMAAPGLRCDITDAADWLATVFRNVGMVEEPGAGHEWEYDLSSVDPPGEVPEGFTVGSLADDDPATHQAIATCVAAAFDTDRDLRAALVTIEANPLFRPELSVVALSPDGRVAAYCRGTVDPGNGVCGIDPVATHPDFQRMGLATAVVRTCFQTQRDLGGRFSYVGSAAEPAPSTFLYRSLEPSHAYAVSSWTR